MYLRLGPLIIGLLAVFFFAGPSLSTELLILTEELAPYNYVDEATGNPAGFSVDIVNMLLKRTGIRAAGNTIVFHPWARAYKMVRKRQNTLLFTMARTSPRESLFKWVGPIAPRCIWLWRLAERSDVVVRSMADVRKYTIGGPIGHAATRYLEDSGFRIVYAPSPALVTQMLAHHRIDMITGTDLIAAYTMKQLGRRFNELDRLIKVDDRYGYYLALNPETDDEIVTRLQRALDQSKADGEYDRIKAAYF